MRKEQSEFDKFDHAMREILKVPHSEIKAKMDKEKQAKKSKPKAKKATSGTK